VYADEKLIVPIQRDNCVEQIRNVAHLPGIVGRSYAMPDAHWGYGFPIGGVAATDPAEGGVISPGGVGYDINCGCRLMSTRLAKKDVEPKLDRIVTGLYRDVPSGVGSSGAIEKLNVKELKKLLRMGSAWSIGRGMGSQEDLDHIEERGALEFADPDALSDRALERGRDQVGTLGSGNHFLEIGYVDAVFDGKLASFFGLDVETVTLMVHTGSRGLGYQVCDDTIKTMMAATAKYKFELPDRQLACAPVESPEGQRYLGAMAAAANYAWTNRQVIMSLTRDSFHRNIGMGPGDVGISLIYDVCHNIAKLEEHVVEGEKRRLCVHRKGATRAFPPGHPAIPAAYKQVGQPVLVPGSMGTASYLCVGTEVAMEKSFGSACHGAGRVMSRKKALKIARGRGIARELGDQGVVVRSRGKRTLAEEMPEAYKDVDAVVDVMHNTGICKKVVRIRPLGVVKG